VSQRERFAGAQAQVNAAKAHYENAACSFPTRRSAVPISGVVADRSVYPGEMPASGTPIISIVDISQVVARANVPVKEASRDQGGPAGHASPDPMAIFRARSRW
jgi:multidrug resistance efflux pump